MSKLSFLVELEFDDQKASQTLRLSIDQAISNSLTKKKLGLRKVTTYVRRLELHEVAALELLTAIEHRILVDVENELDGRGFNSSDFGR